MSKVWLMEAGTSWDRMATTAVLRKEPFALRALRHMVDEAQPGVPHKIKIYTYEDGSHCASWGSTRLRIRKVRVV